ncbi:MAG: hypothetical protein AAGC55_04535, partial [Myxococcota bacterium]
RIVTRDALPPSAWAPECPPELDAIVTRALSRNVNNRYQSARELASDLEAFALAHGLRDGAEDLGSYVRRHFPKAARASEQLREDFESARAQPSAERAGSQRLTSEADDRPAGETAGETEDDASDCAIAARPHGLGKAGTAAITPAPILSERDDRPSRGHRAPAVSSNTSSGISGHRLGQNSSQSLTNTSGLHQRSRIRHRRRFNRPLVALSAAAILCITGVGWALDAIDLDPFGLYTDVPDRAPAASADLPAGDGIPSYAAPRRSIQAAAPADATAIPQLAMVTDTARTLASAAVAPMAELPVTTSAAIPSPPHSRKLERTEPAPRAPATRETDTDRAAKRASRTRAKARTGNAAKADSSRHPQARKSKRAVAKRKRARRARRGAASRSSRPKSTRIHQRWDHESALPPPAAP